VGEAETVAERIREYHALGIETFIFSGYPHLEEAYRAAELLFPRLALEHEEAPRVKTHCQRPLQSKGRWLPTNCYRVELSRKFKFTMIASINWTSWGNRALPWLLPTFLVAAWQGASTVGWLPGNVVPSPFSVLLAGIHLAGTGELAIHLWESFRRAMAGLFIGGTIGFLLGITNGLFTMSDRYWIPPSR
jgi:hypothetical protein